MRWLSALLLDTALLAVVPPAQKKNLLHGAPGGTNQFILGGSALLVLATRQDSCAGGLGDVGNGLLCCGISPVVRGLGRLLGLVSWDTTAALATAAY
jgi:hypothetical protein